MDSDDEWEEDPEGESIGSHTGSEDEDSDMEAGDAAPVDELDYSDKFLCPDDYVEYCDREEGDIDMDPQPLKAQQASSLPPTERKPVIFGIVYDLAADAAPKAGDMLRRGRIITYGPLPITIPGFSGETLSAVTPASAAVADAAVTPSAGSGATAPAASPAGGSNRSRVVSETELPVLIRILLSPAAMSLDKAVALFKIECPDTKASEMQVCCCAACHVVRRCVQPVRLACADSLQD